MNTRVSEIGHPSYLRGAATSLFASAKRWMTVGLTMRGAVYLVGLSSIFTFTAPVSAVVLVFVLTILSELSLLRADGKKSVAESVVRILDLHDSFGTPIPTAYVADILVGVPDDVTPENDAYFASTDPVGPRRALANLQESAWWSKHVARYTWQAITILLAVLLVLSIAALAESAQFVSTLAHQQVIARVVTATLLLALSLGLLRILYAYWSFSEAASRIDLHAQKAVPTVDIALGLWRDYHLARAGTPMLPTFLWRWKNASLNKKWQALRTK